MGLSARPKLFAFIVTWIELPSEYIESHLPLVWQAHSGCREPPAPPCKRHAMLEGLPRRRLDNPTSNQLSKALTKWVATACNLINIVEDKGLFEIVCIASKWLLVHYVLPSTATTVIKLAWRRESSSGALGRKHGYAQRWLLDASQ